MNERAEARETPGRSSRLDPHPRAGGEEVGPRGQRLVLEKQDRAEKLSAEAPGGLKQRLTAPSDRAAAYQEVGPHRGGEPKAAGSELPTDRAAERAHPARIFASTGAAPASDNDVSSSRPVETNPAPVARPEGPSNTGASRPPARSESIARQVAELLAGQSRTGRSARAVTGTEQPTAARAAVGPADAPSATRQRGRGGTARTPAPEPTVPKRADTSQRSAFDSLVRSMRMQVGSNRSTVRLRLEPPELGWMRIEARVEGSRVQLFVQTETARGGELLRSRVAELQAALEQHGLRIDRFELTQAPAQGQQNPDRDSAETGERDANQSSSGRDPDGQASGGEYPARQTHHEALMAGNQEGEGSEPSTVAAGEMRLDVRV